MVHFITQRQGLDNDIVDQLVMAVMEEPVKKHRPGGQDHDQSTHGNWARGLNRHKNDLMAGQQQMPGVGGGLRKTSDGRYVYTLPGGDMFELMMKNPDGSFSITGMTINSPDYGFWEGDGLVGAGNPMTASNGSGSGFDHYSVLDPADPSLANMMTRDPDVITAFMTEHAEHFKDKPVIVINDNGANALNLSGDRGQVASYLAAHELDTSTMYFMVDGEVFSREMSAEWTGNLQAGSRMALAGGFLMPDGDWSLAESLSDSSENMTVWENKQLAWGEYLLEKTGQELESYVDSTLNYSDYEGQIAFVSGLGPEIATWGGWEYAARDPQGLYGTLMGNYLGSNDSLSTDAYQYINSHAGDLGVTYNDDGFWVRSGAQEITEGLDRPGEGMFSDAAATAIKTRVREAMKPLGYGTDTVVRANGVQAKVFDGGNQIGKFHFRSENGGEGIYLSLAEVDDSYQGKGIATALYLNLLPILEDTGANTLTMNANIKVGSYTWSNMGFLPLDGYQLGKVQGVVGDRMGESFWSKFSSDNPDFGVAVERFASSTDLDAIWKFIDSTEQYKNERGFARSSEIMYHTSFDARLDLTNYYQSERLYTTIGTEHWGKDPVTNRFLPRDADGDGIIYEGTDHEVRIGPPKPGAEPDRVIAYRTLGRST